MGIGRTDCFSETAKNHGDQVCPCFVLHALEELEQQAETKEGAEESIGAEVGVIPVDRVC